MIPVSIDKVLFHSSDFEINNSNKLKLTPGTLDFETGEMIKDFPLFAIDGEQFSGSKAYYNSDTCQIDINRNGLVCQFTPSIVVNKQHNFYPVTHSQFKDAVKTIEASIKDAGIRMSIGKGTIHRLDLERTFQPKYPFNYYSPVFQIMSAKRMNPVNYGTTYSFRNKSREASIYDKLFEMQSKKIDTSFLIGNWLRAEYRMKKRDIIKKDAEISNLSELQNKTVFESLTDIYKSRMNTLIFSEKTKGKKTYNYDSELELLKAYRQSFKKNAILRYVSNLGFIKMTISPDDFFNLVRDAGFSRMHAFRAKNMFLEEIKMQVATRDMDVSELYNELRELIAA